MTCQELIDFLMDYVEGDLPGGETRAFDEHLGICTHCRDYLASYRETVRLGKMICHGEAGELPSDVPEDLVAAILEARRGAD